MALKEIKFGLVGSGFIGGVHADAIAQIPGAQITAHCDVDEERGKGFREERKIEQGFGDLGAMLEGSDIDAVLLGVPNHLHARLGIQAMEAGKHIIVEKPLCLTLGDADAMIAAAEKAKVVLGYAEELCFAPKYVRAKEIADEGAIGDIYRINQYEKHAGPYSDWFWQAETAGGGILMDMGCHSIEWARWMLGKPKVRAVTAIMDTVLHKERTELEDDCIIHLEFETGQAALLESSWALHGGMDSYGHVFGTQGVVHVDLLRGQGLLVHSLPGYGEYAPGNRGWTMPDYEWSWNNGYPQEDAHFIDCMRSGATPTENGQDGKAVLEIMLACYASAAQGRRVELPYTPPADIRVPVDLWLRSKKG